MNGPPPDHGSQERTGRRLAGRMVDAVVAPFVQPVVDAVDVRGVVDRIDVEDVLGRIDIDELLGRIDVDALVGRLDVDALVGKIDVDALVGRLDVDALVGRLDVNGLLDRVEPDRLLDRVDPDRLLDRVNPDRLLDRVDPDRLLDRVNPDRLLDRVDPNRLLDRVDPNRLLDRVDADRLLDRVDLDRVIGRIDVNAVMDRVDVNSLVARTELGEVIARSTTGVFGQLLDSARMAVMSFDLALHGLAARVLHRSDPTAQLGPGLISDQTQVWRLRPQDRAVALQGRYAGAVSRFLAFWLDMAVSGAIFGVIVALVTSALRIVADVTWTTGDHRLLVAITYMTWQFTYFAGLTAMSGRTIGKSVLGVFVVQQDGTHVTAKGAALRTIAFPISFLLFGAGFLLGVVRRDRRQLHDLIGGTSVVYAWDAETARLRSRSPETAPV